MIIAILLYRIDTSRLALTALDNKVDIIDIINIFVSILLCEGEVGVLVGCRQVSPAANPPARKTTGGACRLRYQKSRIFLTKYAYES